MAIERQEPFTKQPINDDEAQLNQEIDILKTEDEEGFTMMEDGSAILGDEDEEEASVGFDDNLAELIYESNQIK